MKKAKFALALITVFAIAGGTLALKANKRGLGRVYCPTTTNPAALAISTVNYVPFIVSGAATTTKPCALTTNYATTTTTTAGLFGTVYSTIQ
ncbi:hypothetical protein SAMN05428988_4256 [Chitinophaga sp. YR573]|uniref:hypothetical protein n=1 Tax=Chitinophaga sp. YR573 TaxID=1881040 RepID=UPI0008BBC996|nr:hypothetical protein [Chitinophaga sp. YR573]SEW34989.1 hypothetical protein SAMN05428988_4256 [Chitinophaga sp. YR573]